MRAHVGGAHGHDGPADDGPAEDHLLVNTLTLRLGRGDLRIDLSDLRDLGLARRRRRREALLQLRRRAARPRRLVGVRVKGGVQGRDRAKGRVR